MVQFGVIPSILKSAALTKGDPQHGGMKPSSEKRAMVVSPPFPVNTNAFQAARQKDILTLAAGRTPRTFFVHQPTQDQMGHVLLTLC